LTRRGLDHYAQLARSKGIPSRSYFKLEELDRRFHLIRAGFQVLDLGAAPGGWSSYLLQRVGPSGTVTAVDLRPLEIPPADNLRAIIGDIRNRELLVDLLKNQRTDLVVSDMAPMTSGVKDLDHQRSAELVEAAWTVAEERLKPNGHFLAKLFHGPELARLRELLKSQMRHVTLEKPKSSRSESREIFLLGRDRI